MLTLLALATTVISCSASAPTQLGVGTLVSADELSRLDLNSTLIDESRGISIEVSDCTVSRNGVLNAVTRIDNPLGPASIILVLALEGIGIEHLSWEIPTGQSELQFTSSLFSDEAIEERLIPALSTATLGETVCFVAIVAAESDAPVTLRWPNSTSTLVADLE